MDNPQTSIDFDITSAIRSDVVLLCSRENTSVNATVNGTLAREPVQFYMLKYHRDRMLDAAKAFRWDTSPLEGTEAFEELIQVRTFRIEYLLFGIANMGHTTPFWGFPPYVLYQTLGCKTKYSSKHLLLLPKFVSLTHGVGS